MNGSDLMEIMKSFDFRQSGYLSMLADLTERADVISEFMEAYNEDIMYIKKIRCEHNCTGILGKRVDDFASFLISLPVQFNALNQLRIENEKTK